jgi:hypothetical protein
MVTSIGKNSTFTDPDFFPIEYPKKGIWEKHMQQIEWILSVFILLFVVLELIIQFGVRGKSCSLTSSPSNTCPSLSNLVVLITGGIHAILPIVRYYLFLFPFANKYFFNIIKVDYVFTLTGLDKLVKERKAIVSHQSVLDYLSSVDTLFLDKTGIYFFSLFHSLLFFYFFLILIKLINSITQEPSQILSSLSHPLSYSLLSPLYNFFSMRLYLRHVMPVYKRILVTR